MKNHLCLSFGLTMLAVSASAAVSYVDLNSASPTPPYTNWTSAATNIQDAVDAAVAGDQILVTNGVYQTGGRAVFGTMTNRVAVTKAVTVQSVNGSEWTIISGASAVRCAYLTNGATLSGFTLTNGFADVGGGVQCVSTDALVSNCLIAGNSAFYDGGGADSGTLNDCTLIGNAALGESDSHGGAGGGAISCTLNNCTLSGNAALSEPDGLGGRGGGAFACTLTGCTLTGNSATRQYYEPSDGGGASDCTLKNCTLTGNSASFGGGASYSSLSNCTITGNSASGGGGSYYGTLNNCTITGNSAEYSGGGAYRGALHNCTLTHNTAGAGGGFHGGGGRWEQSGTLYNCTVIGNSAEYTGGGVYAATLKNCIVYYNNAPTEANYGYPPYSGRMDYCCTTPMPNAGTGNLTAEPQLTDLFHLSAGSPCRGAGSASDATGLDMDGEPWANPPSIGCDEYYQGAVTGPLSLAIQASYTNVTPGFAVNFTAGISGHASANRWSFGDGTVLSNRPAASHSWAAVGDYPVVLWAYNETYPNGVSATVTVHVVVPPVHYVALGSTNPLAPFTSWTTAATNIQDAVDASSVPGALVLVTNGVYDTGGQAVSGTMTNRVAVTKPLTLRSMNGPGVTVIRGFQVFGTTNGDGAIRCVYLTNGAALVGFTLTNGATLSSGGLDRERSGGGVWCESTSVVVSNCAITGNSAT